MDLNILTPEVFNELNLETFVAFDTETTGFNRMQDDIIEFAAVKYVNGEQVDSVNCLIQPRKDVPQEITRLTGITNDMVKDAPKYEDFHKDIKAFIADYPLVAHNVVFDSEMLSAHFQRMGDEEPPNQLYDSLILSRTFSYWFVDHKLATVARSFGVRQDDAHRATADAEMAGDIFLNLIQMMLATPMNTLRQCTTVLSDVDVHTKPLFINALNYQMKLNAENGIGKRPISPPHRFNVYGETSLSYEGAGEPLKEIDTFELTRHFTKEGALGKALAQFEVRDAQAAMAEAVANSLNQGHFLVAEAGTGVGKSLAYTLPSILWTLANNESGERVVISSNTKNLQEQLFYKDIPFIHDKMGFEFKAVLLKGRSNYLCKTKWHEFLRNTGNYSKKDRISALPLVVWASQTQTGDISENNGFHEYRNAGLWSRL
ncbi:MAG: DEAD/DEAH box helicase, partial [Candidatus Marinimicrobia bacterium]|nr:DEAD/DEAH box helicase [Candidatus Neomarinimicrobiota bacterium]